MPKFMPTGAVGSMGDDSADYESGARHSVEALLRQLGEVVGEVVADSYSLKAENEGLRQLLKRQAAHSPAAGSDLKVNDCASQNDVELVICSQTKFCDKLPNTSGEKQEYAGPVGTADSCQHDSPLSVALSGGVAEGLAIRDAGASSDCREVSSQGSCPVSPTSLLTHTKSANAAEEVKSGSYCSASNDHMQAVWKLALPRSNTFLDVASATTLTIKDARKPSPVEVYEGRFKSLISYPGSPGRNAWEAVGFGFILYDLILIPFNAFSPPETWFSKGMEWIVLLFWTANLFASLQVGYVQNGITIMSPTKILIRYLSTWFWLDVAVLVPDWYFTVFQLVNGGSSSSPQDTVKLLRMARLSKCLRLVRAAKLKKAMQSIKDRMASEHTGIILNIVKMIFLLLLVNHYIASFWFAVGNSDNTGLSHSWVQTYGYDKADWFTAYCVSLHWSLTQFTPASKVAVQPQNILERCYAILVVIFALVGFSYILGSISTSLARLRALAEDSEKQFWEVRRYLRQNGVSSGLGARIQRFLEHAYSKQQARTDVNNIRIFALLSDNLRSELRLEIARPQLKAHPLFVQLSIKFAPTLRRIATTCIHYQSLAHGDVLFFPGEHATHMYFLVTGLLQYTRPSFEGGVRETEWVEGREDWIAEPVLWVESWYHRGTPIASLESEVLLVHPKTFAETVCLNPAGFDVVASYARGFVDWLSRIDENSLSDIYQGEDLFEEFAGFCCLDPRDIEQCMPHPHMNRRYTMRE